VAAARRACERRGGRDKEAVGRQGGGDGEVRRRQWSFIFDAPHDSGEGEGQQRSSRGGGRRRI
jgi:hypothetical protein